MPLKREHDGEGQSDSNHVTGVQRKKQRMDAARTISVQFAMPGPGNPANTSSSMEGLPSTIDVEKFTEVRAFEINAMQEAMENASAGATHRVWQTLPRHLRRRAASHDVRRVPARLRQKARAEMDVPAKAASKKQAKRGKEKRVKRTEELLKRQVDKSWLETHIWHAKRMKMENMWGYRLAVTPTEKSFRPSHRASLHGCILHDSSYEAIIELKGPEMYLKEVIVDCCDPQTVGPGAVRFTNGSRVCNSHMYKPKSYPFDLIGPVDILWRPVSAETSSTSEQSKSSKAKGKQRHAPPKDVSQRTLWIRVHPLIYDEVISSIKFTVQSCLQLVNRTSKKEVQIEVADLRNQFNIFELMGPKSSQVIHGALSPILDDRQEEFKKAWSALGQLQTAGSAPRGMVIGHLALDPRLDFPPKNTRVVLDEKQLLDASLPSGLWPTSKLATCAIWDEAIRAGLGKPRFKKKDIDSRKAKHLVPGSKLSPLRQDDRVPILLIQRSIESQNGPGYSEKNSTRSLHGWTLIVPKGWGMPFFSSLTHTGTRVGGQREREMQHFEAGCAHFPHDYPCTSGYAGFAADRAHEERERWERKPPAKRPNWEKLETRSPWKPEWEVVLGLKTTEANEADLVTTQRDAQEGMKVEDAPRLQPWLLRGQEVQAVVDTISHSLDPTRDLFAKVNEWRSKRSISALGASADALLQAALVSVRLSIPRSGSPDDNAIIYKMSDEEARKWRPLLECGKSEFSESVPSELKSSPDSVVGYVTSGNYSLSIGRGQALGAVALSSYLDMKAQLHRSRLEKPSSLPLVKFRNRDSTICRAAYAELVC